MQVWWRGVNDRKREVEEKAKQLEQVASLSALIAGFALVSLVEINIQGALFLPGISYDHPQSFLPQHLYLWAGLGLSLSKRAMLDVVSFQRFLSTFVSKPSMFSWLMVYVGRQS